MILILDLAHRQFTCFVLPLYVVCLSYLTNSRKFAMPLSATTVNLKCFVVVGLNMPVALLWSSRRGWARCSGDVRQQQEADGAQHEQQETLFLQGAWGRATSAEEVVYLSNRQLSTYRELYSLCDRFFVSSLVTLNVFPERCCEIQRWGTSWSPTPPTLTMWLTWDPVMGSRSLKICPWYTHTH